MLRFIRAWLYPRGYSTFEQRIQSLLKFMDAAARGDGQLMAATRQRMRTEEGLDTRKEPPIPDYGRYSIGQNLSVYCNEKEPFESMEDYQRAVAGSVILRALLQGFGDPGACSLWPAGQAEAAARTGFYDGPQFVFTGELDASSSGPAGYQIAMLNANARNVVFRNGMHGQFPKEPPRRRRTLTTGCVRCGWHAHSWPIRRQGWIPVARTRGDCGSSGSRAGDARRHPLIIR